MIKRLAGSVREFKRPAILTFLFIVLEAMIECIIPFITAKLLDSIREGTTLPAILKIGALLIGGAMLSLCCGGIAGYTSAKASAGFARNLRHDIFERVQTFSFDNIDKFNSASLVTRMTTDIANVQMSFMMLIRIAIRADSGRTR